MVLPNLFQVFQPPSLVFKQFSENKITNFERLFLNLLVVVALREMLIILDSKKYLSLRYSILPKASNINPLFISMFCGILDPQILKTNLVGANVSYDKENIILLVAPLGVVLCDQWTPSSIVWSMKFFKVMAFLDSMDDNLVDHFSLSVALSLFQC